MKVGSELKRHIVQGEHLIVDRADVTISTILGSCVAACMRDPRAGVGGMNHFLLPGEDRDRSGAQYGAYLMELLINGLLARGARRDRLECKLFGGARLLNGMTDVGRQNAEFAERFLRDESIAYLGGSLGGEQARLIQYQPGTGKVLQQKLAGQQQVFAKESKPAPVQDSGDLELWAA